MEATSAADGDRLTIPRPTRVYDRIRALRFACWIVAIVVGATYAWAARHAMNADGISYMDIGDAFMHGDWGAAINGCWSPLYPWMLGAAARVLQPSTYWAFGVPHLVNFLLYTVSLVAFDFLLCQLRRRLQLSIENHTQPGVGPISSWSITVLGFALFIYFSTGYTTLWLVTPDLLVAAIVFFLCGLLLRLSVSPGSWTTFLGLGVVLGIGYLTKTILFVLGFLFLVSAFLLQRKLMGSKAALRRSGLALMIFALISAPFIFALSVQKGRPTLGESGKLNYAWFVNGVPQYVHWRGLPAGSGTPVHPTRQLFAEPPTYEFGEPVGGTYPPWYDPSYWHEGLRCPVSFQRAIRTVGTNLRLYGSTIVRTQGLLVLGACVGLMLASRRRILAGLAGQWMILIPGLGMLAMYSMVTVFVDPRYLSPAFLILWMAVFAAPRFQGPRRVAADILLAGLAIAQLSFGAPAMHSHYPRSSVLGTMAAMLDDVLNGRDVFMDLSLQAAMDLKDRGLRPNDKVAVIGDSFTQFWARLASVQIVAEVPASGTPLFWQAGPEKQTAIFDAFRKSGARLVVTASLSDQMSAYLLSVGWHQLGESNFFARGL